MTTELETRNTKLETDLKELAQDIVRRAMTGGATAAECVVREGDEFSTVVRLGQVETLKESGSRAVGIRVFNGTRAASTYSSDFSQAGLDRMLKSALELAKITSEDPFSGIPDASQLGQLQGNLDLYQFDQVPDVMVVETRNCPPALLDEERARDLVVEKFRRVVFNQGFFRLRSPQFAAHPLPGEIHVPYWVAFRGQGAQANLEVIDAVRRRPEGAKVKKMLEEWLRSSA